MNPKIERIEVYLDDGQEPIQVITQPPFKARLDTRTLADGAHTLRVVTVFKDGSREEHRLSFVVDNLPDAFVEGIDEDQRVRGEVEFDVTVGDYDRPVEKGGVSPWLYVWGTAIVLFVVWAFFAFSPTAKTMAEEVAQKPAATAEAPAGSGAPVDQALFDKGKALYAEKCAACHQADGKGLPGTFPALAGSKVVADVEAAVKKITQGGGGMPAFKDLTPEDLAAILTYIRNDFGNSYGGVSVEDVKKALGQGGGEAPAEEKAEPEAQAAPPAGAASDLVAEGEKIFQTNCASCHGPGGEGVPPMFPALKGNDNLKDKAFVIERILKGKGAMPPFSRLSDREIAAVASYVRAKLNDFGPVTEDDVKALR